MAKADDSLVEAASSVDRVQVDAPGAQGVQVGDGNVMVNQFLLGGISVNWPVRVGRPPLLADAFQERGALRQATGRMLAAGGTGAETQVLVGDGGTGKTQLATALFGNACRRGADLAIWVAATSRGAVAEAYAQANASLDPGSGDGDAELGAHAFLAWLASTDRSWIVVLDDVADPGELAELWPGGPSGQVVVTTRRRDAAMAARGPLLEVGVFSAEEALGYLTAKLGRVAGLPAGALSEARELAADLGHLPLALAQAAAVIVNDAISCAAYRVLLADRTRTLSELFPTEPHASGDEYGRTLAGTWSLAVDRADDLVPRGLARRLLALIAVLDPHGIPEVVLTGRAARAFLSLDSPVGGACSDKPIRVAETDPRCTLRNLHRLSLVVHDPNDPVRSVRVHALAQRSIIESLDNRVLPAVVQAAGDALLEAWPTVEADPGLGQVLRASATALADVDRGALWQPSAHAVVFRLGRSLGEAGLVADATGHFRTAVADAERELGPDHPDALSARYELAYWRGEAGDFAGAASAQDELLADRHRVLGPGHRDTLRTRANIAYWRGHAGDPGGAAAATRAVVADMTEFLGPDDPATLSARHNLATWIGQAGDPAAAAAATEDLLADSLRVLGPDHSDTLDTRRNLAHWRGQAGDAAGAAAALEQVVADHTRVLGSDHPDTMHSRDNLAQWTGQAGDPAGAATAFEHLLDDRLRVLGPDHPHTLRTRRALAEWRGHAGDATGSAAEFEEVLADTLRVLGADHPYALTARYHLGSSYGEAHGARRALEVLGPLVADVQDVLGPDHPQTFAARHNLAYWQGQAGDTAGAIAALGQLLDDQAPILGADHPDTLAVRGNLAHMQVGAADRAAGAALRQLLADQLRILGPDDVNTFETRRDLATLRARAGDTAGAIADLDQLLADQRRALGPDHPQTLTTGSHLADVRGNTGDPVDPRERRDDLPPRTDR